MRPLGGTRLYDGSSCCLLWATLDVDPCVLMFTSVDSQRRGGLSPSNVDMFDGNGTD